MRTTCTTTALVAILAGITPSLLPAQATPAEPDPFIVSVNEAAAHVRNVFTKAADQMSEADYAFKPTPDVRTFGQLLAHVAETNYWFCSAAMGESSPGTGVEKTKTTRADIQKALAESFAYCERAYAQMSDQAKAKAMRQAQLKTRAMGHKHPSFWAPYLVIGNWL